jgi:branched-chain amino acid transport system substrate-binding protein
LSAAVGYAIAPYLDEKKMLTLYPIVSSEDITQRKRSPYIVRTGWSSAQPSHPFGTWVYDNLKYKKIAMIGYDFAFGWEVAAGFQRTFEEAGGQILQKLWPPLGNADFGPYLAQLRRDVDAIYAIFSGADALRFAKQYADAGLKGRLPLVGGGTLTDEHVLRTMGDESLGIVTALHYSAALENPANKKFAQAYEAKYKQIPSYYSEGTYVAGIALKAALEATGGDIEDTAKFLAALRKVDLSDAPRGPMRFDEYGNPIENIYVRKVERVNGRLQNTVIQTFPAVSQFGTYKAEEFLKQPVYSRDYPPCKHC